jgi:hypothetical protein
MNANAAAAGDEAAMQDVADAMDDAAPAASEHAADTGAAVANALSRASYNGAYYISSHARPA